MHNDLVQEALDFSLYILWKHICCVPSASPLYSFHLSGVPGSTCSPQKQPHEFDFFSPCACPVFSSVGADVNFLQYLLLG